jgi:NitT/TauT family transport system substrate-binding protein
MITAGSMSLFTRPAESQTESTELRVGSVAADTYAEAFYALDLGLFERAGLNVTVTPFNNSGAMAAAVVGGSLDFGAGDAAELANGFNRGIPFVVIAGGALYSSSAPTTALCVTSSSTISRATDLEGQNVALVSLVSLSSAGLKSWLAQHGADVTKVHFIELPFSQMVTALDRGTVAAACLSEPLMSQALAGSARIFANVFDAIGKQFLISEWYTTQDVLAKKAAAAERFVRVIYDAAQWANTHHTQSAAILAKYAKIDVKLLDRSHRAVYATNLRSEMMQPVLDTALRFGSLATATSAKAMIAKGF